MEDIENLLLEQLDSAIKDVTKEPFGTSSIFDECRRLKDLIKDRRHDPGEEVDATRRENLYYLNNIVAEWRIVLEKHNPYSPTAQIALNQLADRLKKIRKDLEARHDLAARKDESSRHKQAQKVEDEEKPDEKSRGLRNPYHVDPSKIWGIDDKSKAMERLLVRKQTRNREFQAIGIVGMTGVGKTTFCQLAFNNEEVKKHFLPRIWVEMSEQPVENEYYKKEVVKSFMRSLGFEDEVMDKIGAGSSGLSLLLLALRKQLQGKRYLVVLDDIWHRDPRFKEFCSSLSEDGSSGDEEYKQRLSCALPKGSGGCVIVTSRSESWAADMVGQKNLQRITPLEDKTSIWNIFVNSSYDQSLLDKEKHSKEEKEEVVKKMRDEIVERCAGLPLMAKMLADDMVQRFLQDEGPKPA